MRKFLAVLLAGLMLVTMAIPSYAAADEEDDGGWGIDFSFLTDWMEDWFPETEVENPELVDEQVSEITESASLGFEVIKSFLLGTEENYVFINGPAITELLASTFLPMGYLVFLICWAVGLAQGAVSLELWETNRNAWLRALITLVAGILLLGISTQILQLLNTIAQNMTAEVITNTELNLDAIAPKSSIEEFKSDVPIVGFIIQWMNYISWSLPILCYNVFVLVCSLIMAVSLGIRVIKLAIYQGVAPVFFGLAASKETSSYFRNFIAQYCAICFQLVITAVIFSAFQVTYVSHLATISVDNFQWSSFMMGGIVMLVYCVMMVKADRLFDRVFR